jgi:hypothetical protein
MLTDQISAFSPFSRKSGSQSGLALQPKVRALRPGLADAPPGPDSHSIFRMLQWSSKKRPFLMEKGVNDGFRPAWKGEQKGQGIDYGDAAFPTLSRMDGRPLHPGMNCEITV